MRTLTAILCFAIFALALPASAQNLDQIRQRMLDRLDEIQEFKTAKTVGEDANGYLHILGELNKEATETVAAENADRRAVYAAIAGRTGANPADVGKARAKTIAQSAAPGVMLQAPDGTWYEKK